ncbi:TVP38/TMEM64 family protein [Paenibacillus glacialis]|uniref:TVP38/TMEM64 family membrane protein n=1 Tax=Paenibacillus glacialis TaxID=494026 RepID=A0A168JP39_9BACL|nr:VTT domain-containing protein [Paenibacillus glacialis]OAB40892.1 SNARE -like protein [Paenibacillus glacialis]
MDKSKKLLISKILLTLLGTIIVILVLKYLPNLLQLTVSIDKFRNYILSMGKLGPTVFILFQILQTVIAPIPGEVIQIAGGYIYGDLLGSIYTIAGMLLGAIIAFYFARFLGGSFIGNLMKKKKFQWMIDMMDNKKISVILLFFFLVPGLPKDLLIYVAGLTLIKPLRFFGILLVGRLPWLVASVSVGSNIYQKDYTSTIIISVIAVLGFILGLIYKDKIINKFYKLGKSTDE